jgi:hypothetical protein
MQPDREVGGWSLVASPPLARVLTDPQEDQIGEFAQPAVTGEVVSRTRRRAPAFATTAVAVRPPERRRVVATAA